AALGQLARYNVTWLTSQAAIEMTRFVEKVAAAEIPGSGVSTDDVQVRFAVMQNRLRILRDGEVAEFIARDPELVATVAQLEHALQEAEPLIATLPKVEAAQRLLELLTPLEVNMVRLASAALNASSERAAADQQQLNWLHWVFFGLLAVLIACCILLISLVLMDNRIIRRERSTVEDLALSLQQAMDKLSSANEDLQTQNQILQERDRALNIQNSRFDAALNNMSQALCMG